MRLPPRPTATDSTTARLVDAVLLELYELQQVHALAEEGIAHDTNRKAAQRAYDEVVSLLATAPPEIQQWATRARYVADLMINELTESAA